MEFKRSLLGNAPYQYGDLLHANRKLDFVQRVLNPKDAPKPINNGSVRETHRMSAEFLGNNDTLPAAFPLIVNKNGTLVKLDRKQARDHAVKTGEYIAFQDIESAVKFTQSYKTPEFRDYYGGK